MLMKKAFYLLSLFLISLSFSVVLEQNCKKTQFEARQLNNKSHYKSTMTASSELNYNQVWFVVTKNTDNVYSTSVNLNEAKNKLAQ